MTLDEPDELLLRGAGLSLLPSLGLLPGSPLLRGGGLALPSPLLGLLPGSFVAWAFSATKVAAAMKANIATAKSFFAFDMIFSLGFRCMMHRIEMEIEPAWAFPLFPEEQGSAQFPCHTENFGRQAP